MLTFGDLFSNALAEIKAHTGKKIGILQDEISYAFHPALSSKTIESWRYRQAPPTIEQLETLAEALLGYRCPQHDGAWLLAFLSAANHPYPQALGARFFPHDEQFAEALAVQFAPPPLSAYAPPPPPPAFAGRAQEIAAYRRMLAESGLAIVSGMPGIGKTAAAAVLARETPAERCFWHSFRDVNIQAFVTRLAGFLAHHARAELWEMLEAARLTRSAPPDLAVAFDLLAAHLPQMDILLCLDDLHLVEGDRSLQLFLQRATAPGGARLLITSRRYLSFLPGSGQKELLGLTRQEAKATLQQRGVALPEALNATLHEATGGNATFLMLAAVALRSAKRPEALIQRLARIGDIERFLMEEVNDHLSGEEQRVMEALAILKGRAADRATLEYLIAQQDVRRALRNLEDQFLVMAAGGPGERAYNQHEIIAAFYYDQPRHGARLALHRRAGDYFSAIAPHAFTAARQYALAAAPQEALRVARQGLWEIVNDGQAASLLQILAAMAPGALSAQEEVERRLLCGRLQALGGAYEAARESYEAADLLLDGIYREGAKEAKGEKEAEVGRARLCLGMAELLEREAPAEALQWAQRGLALVPAAERELGARLTMAAGAVQMHMGNFGGAQEMLHDGLEQLPAALSPLRAAALKNLGALYFNLGRLAEARDYTLQALTLSRQLRDHLQAARTAINLGPIKYVSGDWQGAIDVLEEGLAIAQKLGARDVSLSLHANLGGMYVEKGDHGQALRHLEAALQLAGERDPQQVITAKIRIAQLALYESRWEAARATLREAEKLARDLNDQASLSTILGYRALAQRGLGQMAAAQALVQEALALDRSLDYQYSKGENLRILGRIAAERGDREAAQQAFRRSLETLAELDPYQAALTQLRWGEWLCSAGESGAGIALLQQAQAQFEALGAAREMGAVQKLLGEP